MYGEQPLELVDTLPQLIEFGERVSGRARDLSRVHAAARSGHDRVLVAKSGAPLLAVVLVHPIRLESQLAETLAARISPGLVSVYGPAQESVKPFVVGVPQGWDRSDPTFPHYGRVPCGRPPYGCPDPRGLTSVIKKPLLHKRNQVIHALGIATERVGATHPHGRRANASRAG